MPDIQKTLIEILTRKHIATVLEMSRAIGVTKPAIQYQIKSLLEQGLIEVAPEIHSTSKRGRPEKHYRLSKQKLPENYCRLAEGFIQFYQLRSDDVHSLEELAEILSKSLETKADRKKPFIKRMRSLLDGLSTQNYQPHWEIHANGSILTFRNCPYAQLSENYPILCEIDRMMLQKVLGVSVKQELTWGESPKRSQGCAFFFAR
jgi:predicted ArsR family transcriptional regulator